MEDRRLYIKIAHWYYTLGMTQDEIAKRLSFTRQKVNRIINSLADLGIVSIQVNGYETGDSRYECALEERFGLKQVIVANTYDAEKDYLLALADTASQYLESILQPGMTIGVSWGQALAATISKLPFKRKSNCTVVQMVGAQNVDKEMVKSDEIARSLADKLDCVCYMLYAPVVVDYKETKTRLMEERSIQKSFELMEQCDLALFGIGQLNHNSTMCQRGLMKREDIDKLRAEGFIGDICMNPVTLKGEGQNCYMRERIISADLTILKKIPNVVAVAGGEDKVEAIIGCLASGVIDTLIIDEGTAKKIVQRLNKSNQSII